MGHVNGIPAGTDCANPGFFLAQKEGLEGGDHTLKYTFSFII